MEKTIEFMKQQRYYSLFGQGLKGMEESHAKAGFNKEGNTVYIYTKLEEEKARAEAREYKEILNKLKENLIRSCKTKESNYYFLKVDRAIRHNACSLKQFHREVEERSDKEVAVGGDISYYSNLYVLKGFHLFSYPNKTISLKKNL